MKTTCLFKISRPLSLPAGQLLVSIPLLSGAWTHATESVVEAWVQRYGASASSFDYPSAIAVDGSGNVFVTGNSHDDYATVKYSGAGMPLWTNRYNGPVNSFDAATGVAVDGSGNVFVTGRSDGGGFNYDYATIKYSGAGVPLWTNRYNGPANLHDQPYAIAVDGSGNVFVTGESWEDSDGRSDYATIKYSGAGVLLWIRRYHSNDDRAADLAVDGSGNVLVTGHSGISSLTDYVTIKYSGAGAVLWTMRYNGPGNANDEARAVAVDGGGNVFVTGHSWGSNFDYATIKYSGAGVPLWTNRYDAPENGRELAAALAVDGGGNVFVTGVTGNLAGSGEDYATIKYSGAGVALWTNRYNGPGNGRDFAVAVAVDGRGNVFLTGHSIGSGSGQDYATIKYSGEGVPLWTNRYHGLANGPDFAVAVAVDGSGNAFVTGNSSSDYATIKYILLPELAMEHSAENVRVSWPLTFSDFVLQQNTNGIQTMNWSDVTEPIGNDGTNHTLVVSPPEGERFYRLSIKSVH